MKETVLYIKNLCCDGEAKLIRAEFDGLKGINSYDINLMTQSVRVSYNPTVLSEKEIQETIFRVGLEARLKAEEKIKEKRGVWWKEPRILTLTVCGFIIAITLIMEHIFGFSSKKAVFLYGAATLIGGYYPAKMGLTALKTLTPNIRTLMVVGAIGAAALGLWEEAALLVLIYSLGDVLEAYATDRVRGAVRALMGLAPKEALVRRNNNEVVLTLEDIKAGDILIVRPGERIPLDGKVLSGSSSVDQAPITGESIPVSKGPGDEVFAGSINQRGSVEVMVTKVFEDTTLGRIIHYVEEAEVRKSSYQRFGDKFGRYYTPSMFALSLTVILIPSALFGDFSEWFYRGLVVLVVSCSCGIALSIPVSVVAAIANAARHGVLIKGGAFIEAASNIRAIAFDKTGSLTRGRPVVTDIIPFGDMREDMLLRLAASMESRSEHILADAIIERAKEKKISFEKVEEFEAIPGMGAKGIIGGMSYCIGSIALCETVGIRDRSAEDKIKRLEEEGKTLIVLTGSEGLLGAIAARDEIRSEAKETLKELKKMGIGGLAMLTGDNENVAQAMAEQAGIDEYMARLMPEDKVLAIEKFKQRHGMVAMVGDGVNDAPAMVVSDLGIAMGAAGTDVAIETGDIVLMSDDLSRIPYVMKLSRKTVNNVRQNIIISLTIIAFLVPIALIGWIGIVPGILINEVGGLIVIINGLRLLR